MKHTYLVEVDDDESDFLSAALEMRDMLESEFNVTSVKPWTQPSNPLMASAVIPPPIGPIG